MLFFVGWIAPSSFTPEVGSELHRRWLVGESFRGRPVARRTHPPFRFVFVDGDGERGVPGRGGRARRLDPPTARGLAGRRVPEWAFVDLEAGRFEEYLRSHGLGSDQ